MAFDVLKETPSMIRGDEDESTREREIVIFYGDDFCPVDVERQRVPNRCKCHLDKLVRLDLSPNM